MDDWPKELERGEEARLFPVASSRQRECHAISTVLAVFRLIPKYAERMLKEEAGALPLTPTRLQAYTEVRFKTKQSGSSKSSKSQQPDGYIVVESRGKRWSALVEAKVKNDELTTTQIEGYLDLARELGVDAVITVSNQFALDPTHHPVSVSGHKTRSVNLFHLSWLSLLSNAQILADSDELTDDEQAFVLRELIRFLNDDKSGVRPFDRMGSEWKELCVAIQHGNPLSKASDIVADAIGDWHQLTRYLALTLSPQIGQSVNVYLKRLHRRDPAKRFEADASDLLKTNCFCDEFEIENAASRIQLTADLAKRLITLSMSLDPPGDKKRPRSAIRWLTKQLDSKDAKNVHIRAEWPGQRNCTIKSLSECIDNPDVLVPDGISDLPTLFLVQRIDYLAGRFSGTRTLVEDVESAFKEFYKSVGQHLRAWTAPPPEYRKQKDTQKLAQDEDSDVQVIEVENEPPHSVSPRTETSHAVPEISTKSADSNDQQITSTEHD